ncbi:MAG: DNA translocase FtsK [Clostridia bacterium]|nr:DNA translocase FtsK [Clostridia bacterium]
MFHTGGFLIRWYRGAFYWLLGYGAEILPVTLLVGGILLLVKRRKKVRLQAAAWGVLPLLFGGVRHLLATHNDYLSGLETVWQMGRDGQALKSGGMLAGGLAELVRAALSTVGAAVVLVVLLIGCFLLGCHLTLARLRAIFGKVKPISEKELPPEPEKEESLPLRRDPARLKHDPKAIDVALDDEAVQVRRPDKQKESPLPPPNVATPAEALRGIFHKDKQDKKAEEAAIAVTAEPEIVDEFIPEPIVDEPVFTDAVPFDEGDDLPPWEEAPAAEAPADDEEPVEEQIRKAMEASEGAPIYLYPPIRLLKPGPGKPEGSAEAIQRCAERLVDTLQSFGVEARVIDTTNGPSVTRYELQLQRGIKFSKVVNLADDIALALGAAGIRVSAIPDKNAVGIEVPNEVQELVTARDIIGHPAFQNAKSKLSFAIGKDITGAPVVGDIAKMPHMLIAGTTGSGKSVCINSILMSILYKASPEEVRLIMVDPKMIELGVYNGIPHLLIPVVTDPKKAAGALNWAVTEMMRRYKLFSEIGARNLAAYNAEIARDPESENEPLPQVVIVIDELADLMAVAKSEVENAIIRLAQMARAAGMHLIIATQRPSADVITGLMKDNIPSRIAFAVASAINSRIILDQSGAEKLLGKGDMLFNPLGLNKPQRIQGCFVSDSEVEEVVAFVKQCGQPEYNQEILDHMERSVQAAEEGGGGAAGGDVDDEDDPVFDEAVEIVVSSGQASVSMLQRRLKLGYSRAARLVDQMEERGIVGPFEGSKPRAVLITKSDWQERMARKRDL